MERRRLAALRWYERRCFGGETPPFHGTRCLDTNAPTHHIDGVRLTVNLEPDLYAVAKSLAKAEDCSLSVAVNRLLRRALSGETGRSGPPVMRNGFVISHGTRPITADTVRQAEEEEDAA